MTIHGFTDGAARGNPGQGGIGVVLKDESGNVLAEGKKYLGKVTNNVAEYSALIECLRRVNALIGEANGFSCSKLVLHSDSELMVRQLNGEYKVKNQELIPLHQAAKELAKRFKTITFTHVPRVLNKVADVEVNRILDEQS